MPRLGNVPHVIETTSSAEIDFAIGAVRAGLLRDKHWIDGRPSESIRKAMSRYDKAVDASVCVSYTHRAQDHYGLEDYLAKEFDRREDIPQHGSVSIHVGGPTFFLVGETLARLEEVMPGAGATVLHTLEAAGREALGILAPSDALDCARTLHWMGEEDETYAIQDEGVEDGAIIKRSQMMTEIPEWAYCPKPIRGWPDFRVVIEPHQRQFRFMDELADTFVHRILDEAAMLYKEADYIHRTVDNQARRVPEFNFMSCPYVLRWGTHDSMDRLLDDMWNDIQQCGERTDLSFATFFPRGDHDGMIKAWQAIEPVIELAHKVQTFIHKLGKPQ